MAESIVDLFLTDGTPVVTSASDPLPLIDPGAVWLVTQGHVDIVAITIVREAEGAVDLQRTHLLRIDTGELLFGFRAPPAGHNVLLLGFGSSEARVSRMPVSRLARSARQGAPAAEATRLVTRWVSAISELCVGDLPPTGTINLRADTETALEGGQSAQPQSGVLWLKPVDGAARFMGHDGTGTIEGEVLFPLGKDAWVTAEGPCRLKAQVSAAVVPDESFWRGLNAFHHTVEAVIDLQRTRDRDSTRRRLVAKSEADRAAMVDAFSDLGSILQRMDRPRVGGGAESALFAACCLVGEPMGIHVRDPGVSRASAEHANPLEEIAAASRFGVRRVTLRGRWHRRDGGPLLGFVDGGDTPVALVPSSPTSYRMHNAAEGTVREVTTKVARQLAPVAFMFYRCLPDRALRGLDLLLFGLRGAARDLTAVGLIGAAAAVLTLATPIAIGHVFDAVIPGAEPTQLLHVTLGLIIAAVAVGAFEMSRNIALIRVQHRAANGLQAAVWDRVMNLPVRFFRRFTAGDLGVRAMGIDAIMEELSTSAITTIVSGIFSLLALGILFYHSPAVAVVALALVLIALGIIIACGVLLMRYQRGVEDCHGKLSGMMLQFMNGIAKIRVAAAEPRAFNQWAARFADQTRLQVKARIVNNNLSVFLAAFPVVTYLVIFYLLARGAGTDLSTGTFLSFLAAYAILLTGMIRLGATVADMLYVVPLYSRMKPILEATPEVSLQKADPGPLRGRIEITNLSFRYEADGPLIIDDVDLHADPGEFIALVGPSGSGKSTLLRILLGFAEPESGTIAYDGFDVAGLDPRVLRRQLGVVLQDGSLLPGDVFTNIVGSVAELTQDDAWEAARLAGLDKDIEEMPMGMHTVITEGASTLSGGQRQRLMIARALVTKPRIVFFDEATSALDNPTQAIVTRSLDRLRATRIVVAHRLSTIVGADRIYVLANGKVVQSGTYKKLVTTEGMFLDLVKRQMA